MASEEDSIFSYISLFLLSPFSIHVFLKQVIDIITKTCVKKCFVHLNPVCRIKPSRFVFISVPPANNDYTLQNMSSLLSIPSISMVI